MTGQPEVVPAGQSAATKAPASLHPENASTPPTPAAPTTRTPAAAAPPAAADMCEAGWSVPVLWSLFAAGWVFVPCWWVGAASGLRSGSDAECLFRRRRGLGPAQTTAWRACVVMSVLSSVALILAAAMLNGQKGPAQQGPYYLAFAGPVDAFPHDLNSPAKLLMVSTAVHSVLHLPSTYPAAFITAWVEDQAPLPPPPPPNRHLLLAPPPDQLVVFGYSLVQAENMPSANDLQNTMDDPQSSSDLAQHLLDGGFIDEEYQGLISVVLFSNGGGGGGGNVLQQLTNGGFSDGILPNLVPIGKKDCEGAWSAWAVCSVPCGGGTQTRTYAITRPARSGGDACPAADGATEPRPCSLEACPLNCTGHPTGTAARLAHCWDCADGTVHGNVRSAGCIAGTTGSASALCNNGTYEITQNCTAAGITFDGVEITNGTAYTFWNGAWGGFDWDAKVFNTERMSDTLQCNGSKVLQASTSSGNQALSVEVPTGNSPRWVRAVNAADTIAVRSMFASAPWADGVTLVLQAVAGNGSIMAEHNVTLGPALTFIDLTEQPAFQDTHKLAFAGFGGSPWCTGSTTNTGAAETVVIDNLDITAGPARDCIADWVPDHCSTMCGPGHNVNVRGSITQAAANGGASCAAPGTEQQTTDPCYIQGCPDCNMGWQDVPGTCTATGGPSISACVRHGSKTQVFNASLANDTIGYCDTVHKLVDNSTTRLAPCQYTGCCSGAWHNLTACNNVCYNNTRQQVFIEGPASPGRHLLIPMDQPCDYNGTVKTVNCTPVDPCCSSRGQWWMIHPCNATFGGGKVTMQYHIDEVLSMQTVENGACIFNNTVQVWPCNLDPAPFNCTGTFTSWTDCSAPCGNGTQSTTFTYTGPPGDTNCSALNATVSNRTCNPSPCAG